MDVSLMNNPPRVSIGKAVIAVVIVLGMAVWVSQRRSRTALVELRGQTMGTTYEIKIPRCPLDTEQWDALKGEISDLLARINNQMSTYDAGSEISGVNRKAVRGAVPISPGFAEVLGFALELSERSGGAFDPTLGPLIDLWGFGSAGSRIRAPADSEIAAAKTRIGYRHVRLHPGGRVEKLMPRIQLNLSAVAKGYAVDRIADALRAAGCTDYMVEIGGELAARGRNQQGEPWRFGVEAPTIDNSPARGREVEEVVIGAHAIASSGDYRNYFEEDGRVFSHIIDPRTGWPITNRIASVTVIATNCMLADGLATALMVLDPEAGLELVAQYPDTEAFILRRKDGDLERFASQGFQNYLSPE
jgi:thiamine biosynthesis lipoprotein